MFCRNVIYNCPQHISRDLIITFIADNSAISRCLDIRTPINIDISPLFYRLNRNSLQTRLPPLNPIPNTRTDASKLSATRLYTHISPTLFQQPSLPPPLSSQPIPKLNGVSSIALSRLSLAPGLA